MIVIVANRSDRIAAACASRWAREDVGVLTARDLSVAGWRQRPGQLDSGIAVIEGRLVPQREITGVLTLLPSVTKGELVHIAPADRAYVAAEMTAFLLFWLSGLRCPVLNRPTPMCLSGPGWRREQWVSAAAQAGIPVQPCHRHAVLGSAADQATTASTVVTVAGHSVIGNADSALRAHALRLARFAGVELLAGHFSSRHEDARFVTASTFPDLSDDSVADAVLDHLRTAPVAVA